MKFLSQALFILKIEAQFFTRFPKLLLATAVVVCIPAVYAVIYLSSVWDPASNTGSLPVGLVNLDRGLDYRGHQFNVGREVLATLRTKHTFGFQTFSDESRARREVREGKLAFALIIPSDFSSNAIPGQDVGAGKLVVFTSEGNNFESASIARTFARELGHDVNERINEQRWRLVLESAAGSQRSVQQLREGVAQLRTGSKELGQGADAAASGARQVASGTEKLSTGVGQLSGGMRQLGAALRAIDAKRPRGKDLDRLKEGAEALSDGHTELAKGMSGLKDGSKQLVNATNGFRTEAKSSAMVPARVGDALDQLGNGMEQLDGGLHMAAEAQRRLSDGAGQLSAGVGAMTTGVRAMNTALRTVVTKLPEDSQMDAIDTGAATLTAATSTLAEGTARMRLGVDRIDGGLALLWNSLPSAVNGPEGSAEGLANSVQPVVEVEAQVANSGSAFSANVVPAALWLGAGIAAFLIHVRVLPRHAQFFSRPAQLIGKMTIPLLVVWFQAGLLFAVAMVGLHIHLSDPWAFAVCLVISAATFLAIVFAMTRAFGDAGKALAMIFLAIQLSSSGGILPVELSGGLFANISPWLPLTWVIRAMKAAMFGAYGGEWLFPIAMVALAGLVAATSACWIGRWRFVKHTTVRPAVDF